MKRIYYLYLLFFSVTLLGHGQNWEPPQTTDYNNITMPESPTAAAFQKVGETDVNTATGVPSISIPLYTFELDGVEVPISVSYDATGVKVRDLATSVGLNWSLNVGGQISRTVKGKADEMEGWFNTDSTPGEGYSFLSNEWFQLYNNGLDPYVWQRAMVGHSTGFPSKAKEHDHNPDQFHYSILGYSGGFIFTPYGDMIKENTDGLKIYNWENPDDDFMAKDLQGNSFVFLDKDTERGNNKNIYASNHNTDDFDWEHDGYIPATAWKLSKIITKNNKHIHFEYDSIPMLYEIPYVESNFTIGYDCEYPPNPIKTFSYTNITYNYYTRLIKTIHSPDGNIEVLFTYENDLSASLWKTKLTKITINDLLDSSKKKEFVFEYGYFNGEPRLKLKNLFEKGYDGQTVSQKPPYRFTYNENALPEKTDLRQDFFGYFSNRNAPQGNRSLVHMTQAIINNLPVLFQGFANQHSRDRSLNANAIQNGILTKIEYPTGGLTRFEFQPNLLNGRYVGGLRVKKIENIDKNEVYHKREFQYEDLRGIGMESFSRTTKEQGAADSYFSSFVEPVGGPSLFKPGYFYGKVTIMYSGENKNFKEEHFYEEKTQSGFKYQYALTEIRYYKENAVNPIKTVEYINDIIGEVDELQWNVLGDMMCFGFGSNRSALGHNNVPIPIVYRGNYCYLPTRIVTTDYLGTTRQPVTTTRDISYDSETLLKTEEILDVDNEIRTTKYSYPSISDGFPADFPKGLLIGKEVFSYINNDTIKIIGQYFEYDSTGNIKRTYQYNKGKVGNNGAPAYVPSNYEEMANFLFSNGNPVQVSNKDGEPTTYIWGLNGQFPVAKIEGKARALIPQYIIDNVEGAGYADLPTKLADLRGHPALAGAMVTTFTYKPLAGVETITDPKGDKQNFEYDPFGRLLFVRDAQDNILSENEYNYAH